MPTEKRTRVEIFLPIRSDLSAYQTALNWLAEEFAYARGGSTLTTPFAGIYASSNQIDIVQDATVFCSAILNSMSKKSKILRKRSAIWKTSKSF